MPRWALTKPQPTPRAQQAIMPGCPFLPYYLLTSKVTPVTRQLSFLKNVPKSTNVHYRLKLSNPAMTLGMTPVCQRFLFRSPGAWSAWPPVSERALGWVGLSILPDRELAVKTGHLAFLQHTSPCTSCHCSPGRWLVPLLTRLTGQTRCPDLDFMRAQTPTSCIPQI